MSMNRIVVIKDKNYTTIHNLIVKDSRISLKSKGFLLSVMSLPPDWDFSIRGMVAVLKEGKAAVYTAIKELEGFGYCTKRQLKEHGKITSMEYTFYEAPRTDFRYLENQEQENPDVENRTQLSTKEIKSVVHKRKTNKSVCVSGTPNTNGNGHQEGSAFSLEQRFSAIQRGQRMGLFAGVENITALATARQDGQIDFLLKDLLEMKG